MIGFMELIKVQVLHSYNSFSENFRNVKLTSAEMHYVIIKLNYKNY